jgi:tetraacyldisaccharide 4'-kinase
LPRADWSGIHETEDFHLYTLPLAFISFLYGIGVAVRNYSIRNKGKKLPGFVLSIGNITAGGTGKTPATIMFAEWAKSLGYNVAILSRGYGGKYKQEAAVVSDGKDILLTPEISGDEPWLMANTLRNVPVVVSRTRYLAGLKANDAFGCNFFILDDGFQHINLKRDMDIVLADAEKPFGNGHLLPWGPLREPLSGLKRADAVMLTRSDSLHPERYNRFFYNKPVFKGDHAPDRIFFPSRGRSFDLSYLYGKRVVAFSGIARPDSFKQSLLNLGANVVSFRAFGDHCRFSQKDIQQLIKVQETFNGDILATTEKDWVRIREMAMGIDSLACLTINFVIASGRDELLNMIKEKADAVLK